MLSGQVHPVHMVESERRGDLTSGVAACRCVGVWPASVVLLDKLLDPRVLHHLLERQALRGVLLQQPRDQIASACKPKVSPPWPSTWRWSRHTGRDQVGRVLDRYVLDEVDRGLLGLRLKGRPPDQDCNVTFS